MQARARGAHLKPFSHAVLDLAVLNERLAGRLEPWEARSKLEYLKMRRKHWEFAYEYVTKAEVTATLAVIEEAYVKVGLEPGERR